MRLLPTLAVTGKAPMRKSILVVDDNRNFRGMVRKFFEFEPTNIAVLEATDGVDAIEQTRKCRPDLIIMDLLMPRLNGLDACERLREMHIDVPIVLFTMHGESVSGPMAYSKGVTVVVLKPDFATLGQQVDFLLNPH